MVFQDVKYRIQDTESVLNKAEEVKLYYEAKNNEDDKTQVEEQKEQLEMEEEDSPMETNGQEDMVETIHQEDKEKEEINTISRRVSTSKHFAFIMCVDVKLSILQRFY